MKHYTYPERELIEHILERLDEYDPYVHQVSKDGDSVYIHFENLPNALTHKMRVSDHEERTTYGYKWQLRLDGVPPKNQHKQWSMYFDDPYKLIKTFRAYYQKVAGDDEDDEQSRSDGNVWA